MKNLFYLIVFLITSVVLNSCATMGSSTKLHDFTSINKINSICIAPVRMEDDVLGNTRSKITNFMTSKLKNKLENISDIKFVSYADLELSGYTPDVIHTNDKYYIEIAKQLGFKAIILSVLSYSQNKYETNAIFKLKILNLNSDKLILESEHDTFWGNSYLLPPDVEDATDDAIDGVLKSMVKELKKEKINLKEN